MIVKKLAAALVLAALLAPALAQPAFADGWDHRHNWRTDIGHFNDHDRAYWQHGHWYHGPHQGRDGWWWVLNSGWYFYPKPIYPSPNPFVPPAVIVATPGAVAPAPLPTLVAARYYYCSNPHGYYPYVASCYRPWRAVVTP
jgi:hypothetical protein